MPWAKPGYWSVYRLTCLSSGKSYIGITSDNVNRRWAQHRSQSIGQRRSTALGAAIRKYGPESFALETLQRCLTVEDAVAAERNLIVSFNTISPNGYNLTDGGEYQKNLTAEARKKISDAAKGRSVGLETRAQMGAQRKGRKFSDERKTNMSQAKRLRMADPVKRAAAVATAKKNLEKWNQKRLSDPLWLAAKAAEAAAKEAARSARAAVTAQRDAEKAEWLAGRASREAARVEKVVAFHRGRKRTETTRRRISVKATARVGVARKKNTSGVAGVWFEKGRQLWRAQITINGAAKSLGRFRNADDAIAARRAYEALPEVRAMLLAAKVRAA